MRHKLIAAIVVVALLGGGGWWYARRKTASATAGKDQIIETQVKKGDISVTISGSGPVASVNGVTVKSNQTGTVSQILAKDGDQVKAGQVIMVLDNQSLVSSLNQAKVSLETARGRLDNLLNPLDTSVNAQQLKAQSARLTLRQRQQDVDNLVVKAPQSGIIASVGATLNSSLSANGLLFTIYDDSHPTFVVGLSQEAAGAVRIGANVEVSLTGYGSVKGLVTASGAAATPASGNRDATVPVTIALAPAHGVRPGMVGTVTFSPGIGGSLLRDLPYVVQGNGSIKNETVEVRAQVAGTLDQLAKASDGANLREGDRVVAGEILAWLKNDSLQTQLEQAKNDLAVQEQNLSYLLDPSTDPNDQLRTYKQDVDQAMITLSTRQSDVDDLQVKAPADGQISAMTPRIGDRATSGASLFRVADYGAMQVTISVDELDIAKVKAGQKASITLDALPGKTYAGKVVKINPEGVYRNDIANFDVTVQFDKTEGLMAGMNTSVNVVVTDKPGVLWVPAQAVTVRQGKATVKVKDAAGQPVDKEIQIGMRTDTQVEVTGGLNEGDRIIATIIKATQQSGMRMPGMFGGGGQQSVPAGQRPTTPGGQQSGQQGFPRTQTGGTGGRGN